MCFFCELSKCVWILYYEMCYHCLRVSESCITKYAITAYVCLNLVRQNVLLLSTCVESCTKIVLLLSTCVESCMTKCAIAVYVCWILYDKIAIAVYVCWILMTKCAIVVYVCWILYDKMCYCCLRVLNLDDKVCYCCLRVLNFIWQNVLFLSTCVESCMTKCAIAVYVRWIMYDKMCCCCVRVLNLVWQNVLLLPICIWIFQAERTYGVDSATFEMAFRTSEERINGYFTAFTLSSFQNDSAPTFVTDVSIFF